MLTLQYMKLGRIGEPTLPVALKMVSQLSFTVTTSVAKAPLWLVWTHATLAGTKGERVQRV